MEITYGLPVSSADDEFMAFANGTVSALSTIGSAASTLVDFIPVRESTIIRACIVHSLTVPAILSEAYSNVDAGSRLQASCARGQGHVGGDDAHTISESAQRYGENALLHRVN